MPSRGSKATAGASGPQVVTHTSSSHFAIPYFGSQNPAFSYDSRTTTRAAGPQPPPKGIPWNIEVIDPANENRVQLESIELDEQCRVRDVNEEEEKSYTALNVEEKIDRKEWRGSWKLNSHGRTVYEQERGRSDEHQSGGNKGSAARVGPSWDLANAWQR